MDGVRRRRRGTARGCDANRQKTSHPQPPRAGPRRRLCGVRSWVDTTAVIPSNGTQCDKKLLLPADRVNATIALEHTRKHMTRPGLRRGVSGLTNLTISECRCRFVPSTLGRRHADHAPDPHHARAHVAISVQAPSAPGEHPGLGSRGKAERQRGYSAAHQYVFSSDEMRI
jgi:hypothetical protein